MDKQRQKRCFYDHTLDRIGPNATRDLDTVRKIWNVLDRTIGILNASGSLVVVDLGCGTGRNTILWDDLLNDRALVIGIDFDIHLLRESKRTLSEIKPLHFVVGDVCRLPFKNDVINIIVAHSLLEHVQQYEAVIQEMHRVLKEKAAVYLTTTNRWHPFQGEFNHFPFYPYLPDCLKRIFLESVLPKYPRIANYTEYPAVHWFTYRGLKESLRRAGFAVWTPFEYKVAEDIAEPKRRLVFRLLKRNKATRLAGYVLWKVVTLVCQKI